MKKKLSNVLLTISALVLFLGFGGNSFQHHHIDHPNFVKVDLDVH